MWKSVDGGVTFKSIFDDQPISSIGSIDELTVDPAALLTRVLDT